VDLAAALKAIDQRNMMRKNLLKLLALLLVLVLFYFIVVKVSKGDEYLPAIPKMQIAVQQAHFHATQNGKLVPLMSELIRQVDMELANQKTLSSSSLLRVAALGNAFYPYQSIEEEKLSVRKRSPERGLLLQLLLSAGLDSASWHKLRVMTSFEGADLRKANLYGANLSHMDLRSVDFAGANLMLARFTESELQDANFYGTNLSGLDMRSINGVRADFRWSKLTAANLAGSLLDGAQFQSATMDSIDLSETRLQTAFLQHASLRHANLFKSNPFSALLDSCDFSHANFLEGIVADASMKEANLVGTQFHQALFRTPKLDHAYVDNLYWFDTLTTWEARSIEKIQTIYVVKGDSGGNFWLDRR